LSTAVSSLDRELDAPGREAPVARVRTRWWVEVLVVVWLAWVYDAINNLAPLRLGPALAHGRAILSFETSLGIAPERSLDRWLAAHHSLGLLVSDYYDNAHFIVTVGLLAVLWWQGATRYRPMRNALVAINVIAFVVFWLFPVAPPRMLAGFTDVVASTHAIGSWHTGALASDANQLAAMPSLHIAWALWCTIAVWQLTRLRVLRALAVVYPFVTCFAVLATGNHYLLDVIAGAALVAISFALVLWAPRALARARAKPLPEAVSG
jgi:membrane-associated phospholipid phosphatase